MKYSVRARLAVPAHNNQIWVMLYICLQVKTKLILQCEFFYDRQALTGTSFPSSISPVEKCPLSGQSKHEASSKPGL